MIRVAVDAMGGDRGPEEVVAGALDARSDDVLPVLVGPAGLDTRGLELIEAPDVIGMEEKPTDAVRGKPNSSLVAACRAVGEGKAQAVVSAGNTGAMLAACLLELRRLPGVRRPAIAVTIPARQGASVLLDSGANADARPSAIRRSGSCRSARNRRRAISSRSRRTSCLPPATSTSAATPRAVTSWGAPPTWS